jgi:hypothetical protein
MRIPSSNFIAPEKEQVTKSLVLYICFRLKEQKTFGSTVLNKVLYFIDNVWYKRHKQSISGFSYIRQGKGPTPKPNQFLAIRDSLIAQKLLTIEERDSFGFTMKVPKAAKKPDLGVFTKEQIKFIDDMIDVFKDVNAVIASDMTHNLPAWQIARPMEDLPFSTFLLCQADLTQKDIDWADGVISEYERHGKAA